MYYATTFNQAGQEGQTPNSTYPKGGVSFSKDSFVVNQTLVFQIKFCGKSPALRVAAKRYLLAFKNPKSQTHYCAKSI
jgi:hypothetical protein